MVDVPNMQADNSLNCKSGTPFEEGMQEYPLILSTVHQQRRESLDCNACSSLPSTSDHSETEWAN